MRQFLAVCLLGLQSWVAAGAAPAWQETMLALHEGRPGAPPAPPAGVVATRTEFRPAVESPRDEWFIDGTDTTLIAAIAPDARIARITSPANGVVIALDPDIPPARQRVPFEAASASAAMSLRLDDRKVGGASELHLWPPQSGAHVLALVDDAGRIVDRVLFTVR